MRMSIDDGRQDASANTTERTLTDEELKAARRERFAAMSAKEKVLYFLDYYKIPLIIGTATLLFVFFLVRDITTNIPEGFDAELINAGIWDGEELAAGFAEAAGIDLNAESCIVNVQTVSEKTNAYDQAAMYSAERLMVRLAAGEVDVLAADEATFLGYAANGFFMDLREVLSPEEQAEFAPYLVEASVTDENDQPGDPIPVGIRIDDAPLLKKLDAYPEGGVIGIIGNTAHKERAVQFFHYLYD